MVMMMMTKMILVMVATAMVIMEPAAGPKSVAAAMGPRLADP